MKFRFFRRRRAEPQGNRDPRLRIFAWALGISLVVGYVEFGEPLDVALMIARNMVRAHDADGSIVVAGIDNQSADELGGYPWSRTQDAKFIDRAFALGAKRIFYDKLFADAGDPVGNVALVAALDRAKGKVFFGAAHARNETTSQEELLLPLPIFRNHVLIASLQSETGFGGYANRIVNWPIIDAQAYPSLSIALGNQERRRSGYFKLDYSIRASSVPTFSYTDVIEGRVDRSSVAGKDIAVGATSSSMHDNHWIPGQGPKPGIYTHVIAAHTLRENTPTDFRWWPGLLIGALAALAFMYLPNRKLRNLAFAAGAALLLLLPLALNYFGFTMDVAAGVILATIVGIRFTLFNQAHRNLVSDLPNLAAFRRDARANSQTIIVLRVHNYAEIVASFAADAEREIVDQITHRLRVFDKALMIFQGDEGLFLFTSAMNMTVELGEHLDGHHKILTQPIRISNRKVDLQFGFGVDTSSDTVRSVTTRINSAMVAAVETAARGDKWKHYEPDDALDAEWKLSLLGDLDAAVADRSLRAVFQPKFDLNTSAIVGFEALARWNHPLHGDITPDIFIRAAEDNNRINALTAYMLNDAVESAAWLRRANLAHAMAVNLSSSLLEEPNLVKMVSGVLAVHQFPADQLTLELTESGRAISGKKSLATLHALRDLGVKLSIDDYGTGNATMDYVQSIPTDELKIDKKFVMPMLTSETNRAIVQSMIDLAKQLGRKTVAEGIETPDVEAALRAMGCDVGQGFGLAKPMPFLDLIKLLRNGRHRIAA
jgi:diguanylate cyclase